MPAAEMMIINPRPKRRRRMTAKQLMYFGKRRHRKVRVTRVRRNPVAATRSVAVAPRRRRRYAAYVARARRSARAGAMDVGGFVMRDILPAAIGAGGALALDMVWPHLPLPDAMTNGPFAPAVRIAGAVGIGLAVGAVGGRRLGAQAMSGALIVTLYDMAKGYLATMPAAAPSGSPASVGAYVDGLGWISPARNAGGGGMEIYDRNLGVYVPG